MTASSQQPPLTLKLIIMNTVIHLLVLTTATLAFDNEVFVHEMLKLYNHARDNHEVPRVSLSRQISEESSIWADFLSTSSAPLCLRHSKGGGENLYFYWGTKPITEKELAIKCADAFYKEIKFYNYSNPGFIYPAAHFTEMIWKSVRQIGIAVHVKKYTNHHGGCGVGATPRRPAIGYMVVIRHDPKGNRASRSQFLKNVLRPNRMLRFA